MQQYNSKLESYLKNFQNAIRVPTRDALIGKTLPDQMEITSKPSIVPQPETFDPQITDIPETYRAKAKQLLEFLKSNNSFTWDENGQVKYKDKIIDGSNLTSLLNDTVRSRRIKSPALTFDEFFKALKSEGYSVKKSEMIIPSFKARAISPKKKKPPAKKPLTKKSSSMSEKNLKRARQARAKEILENWNSL